MTLLGPGPAPEGAGPGAPLEGIAALERIEVELAGVEQALVRLDAGTYGRCEVCAGPISDDVLAADPLTPVCSGHLELHLGSRDVHRHVP